MNNTNLSYSDLEPAIREKLAMGGKVRIKPHGTSMLPMIRQGIDEVELTAPKGRLKKYDIPFYKRAGGQFVLHRIVGVKKDSYVLCGDNQTMYEYGICDDMIIGVVCAYIRDGEYISVDNPDYKKYCRNHVRKQFLKRIIFGTRARIKKILKIR